MAYPRLREIAFHGFYVGKVVRMLNNPTIVVITDRNDLDDQLLVRLLIANSFYARHLCRQKTGKRLKNFCGLLPGV